MYVCDRKMGIWGKCMGELFFFEFVFWYIFSDEVIIVGKVVEKVYVF